MKGMQMKPSEFLLKLKKCDTSFLKDKIGRLINLIPNDKEIK